MIQTGHPAADSLSSSNIHWRYLLAEVVLILLFSYMIFFASPHHGLYTPAYLGITAAILTVLALFYLLAARGNRVASQQLTAEIRAAQSVPAPPCMCRSCSGGQGWGLK
jgi:hypothetical protein